LSFFVVDIVICWKLCFLEAITCWSFYCLLEEMFVGSVVLQLLLHVARIVIYYKSCFQLLSFIKRIIVFQLLFLLLSRRVVALLFSFLYPCTLESPKRGATHKDDDDQDQDTKHRKRSLGAFLSMHIWRDKNEKKP
jgi:hypothetical protein